MLLTHSNAVALKIIECAVLIRVNADDHVDVVGALVVAVDAVKELQLLHYEEGELEVVANVAPYQDAYQELDSLLQIKNKKQLK